MRYSCLLLSLMVLPATLLLIKNNPSTLAGHFRRSVMLTSQKGGYLN